MGINWGSILSKAQTCMSQPKMKSRVDDEVDKIALGMKTPSKHVYIPADAAAKLSDVIDDSIRNSGMSAAYQDAIGEFIPGTPVKIGRGRYAIGVYGMQSMSPSLVPEKYGSVDLTMLFNEGAKKGRRMHAVHGIWHGEEIWSRTLIPGYHFLEAAELTFMGNYGAEYNVLKCELNK